MRCTGRRISRQERVQALTSATRVAFSHIQNAVFAFLWIPEPR